MSDRCVGLWEGKCVDAVNQLGSASKTPGRVVEAWRKGSGREKYRPGGSVGVNYEGRVAVETE